MDKRTVFVRTDKGEGEAQGLTDALFGDLKRIFNLVDDESTVTELTKRAPPSLRSGLEASLQELVDGGYIRDMNAPAEEAKPALKISSPAFKMAKPKEPANVPPPPPPISRPDVAKATPQAAFEMPDMPAPQVAPEEVSKRESAPTGGKNDLDFSFIMSDSAGAAPGQAKQANSDAEARLKAEAEARARAEAVAKAAQAKAAQETAAKEAAKRHAYEAAKMKAQIEVAARAKIEAEARAKKEAEAARLKAEQEAMKARQESAIAKAKIEAEVRARLEAEAKVKREAEAIRLKAEQEAERLRRELEEARIKAEVELRNRLEAEARAKAEQEARLKREAEAERMRLEKERAELEAARIKVEAELRMKEEAEARVRAALDARLKSEAEAKARAEQDDRLKWEAEEKTKYHHHTHSEMDPGDKLRASFTQTAGKDFKKQGYTTGSFKLEAFSLVDTGKMPAAKTGEPLKSATPPLPGGGSKVKAAIEERARKKAEEERMQAEQQMAEKAAQDAMRQQKEQAEANRLKQEQEAAARAKTEAEAQRLKAEHEAYRKKIQEEEEAARAAAESQQMVDQQAKQWEEAQQRAQALAIAEQERLAREAAESAKLSVKKARGPRRKLPVGKIAGGLVVLAILAVIALPYIWPLDDYIPSLQAEMSSQLKQPVHIGRMEAALVPLPKLTLHDVSVGKSEGIKAGTVVLNFDISALFAPAKSISELAMENVVLKGSTLGESAAWLQSAGGLERYPVSRMSFRKVRLDVSGMALPTLNGKAEFNSVGKFVHAQFTSEDDRIGIELSPENGNLLFEFNMHSGNLPYFRNLKFKDLNFSANIGSRQIVMTDFFAHIFEGTLNGKGTVDIVNGWKLQGQINARNIDVQKMFPQSVLSGELGGELNLAMSGATPAQLENDPRFEGAFEIKNGEIGKIDLETAARSGVRPGVSGHTNFTMFSGTFRADLKEQHLFVSNLETVNAKTTGVIEVDQGGQLGGKLQIDFKSGLGAADVPARISGSMAEPVLQIGH